jgi:hypothetical protein
MRRTAIQALVAAGVGCALAGWALPAAAAPPDPRLVQVVEEWTRRASKCSSVRHTVEGQTTFVKGSATDDLGRPLNPPKPARDFVGKVAWRVLLDFAAQRHRWEVDEERFLYQQEVFEPVLRLNVCDGTVAQNSRPRPPGAPADNAPVNAANLDMTVVRGNLSTVLFEAGSLPLFHGHGIVPTTEDRVHAGRLRWDARPESFYVHGTGVHGGRPCLVLRTEPIRSSSAMSFHEFWVDVPRQAAILRYAYYSNREVIEDYDVRYQDTPDGWMPASWSHTCFLRGATHTIKRLRVVSREISPALSDEDFRLEVKPGMRVREVEFGASPNPLVMPRSLGDTMQVVGAGGPAEKRWWRPLLWAGAAVAAVALVGLLLYRARKAGPGRRGPAEGVSG